VALKTQAETMYKIIKSFLFIAFLYLYSCTKDIDNINVLTYEELKNEFIQVIPFKGIVLDSDSVLIGELGVYESMSFS
jgi:hypothetical protein